MWIIWHIVEVRNSSCWNLLPRFSSVETIYGQIGWVWKTQLHAHQLLPACLRFINLCSILIWLCRKELGQEHLQKYLLRDRSGQMTVPCKPPSTSHSRQLNFHYIHPGQPLGLSLLLISSLCQQATAQHPDGFLLLWILQGGVSWNQIHSPARLDFLK